MVSAVFLIKQLVYSVASFTPVIWVKRITKLQYRFERQLDLNTSIQTSTSLLWIGGMLPRHYTIDLFLNKYRSFAFHLKCSHLPRLNDSSIDNVWTFPNILVSQFVLVCEFGAENSIAAVRICVQLIDFSDSWCKFFSREFQLDRFLWVLWVWKWVSVHQIQAFITTFKILIADSNQSTFISERFVNRIEESRNELNGLKTDFYGSVSEILDFDNRFHFNSNISTVFHKFFS